jgi:hypothetical protein
MSTARVCGVKRARKSWGVPQVNPAAELEPLPERYSGEYDFYAPEEMLALVRAGDAVIFARPARRTVQPNRHSGLNWPEPAPRNQAKYGCRARPLSRRQHLGRRDERQLHALEPL